MRSFFFVKLCLLALTGMIFSCTGREEVSLETTETKVEINDEAVAESLEIVEEEHGKMKLEKVFYSNGELKMEGNSTDGIKDGKWTSWYETGMIWSETYFENGTKTGSTATWYPNGNKRYEGFFKDGKESGKWAYWDEQGNFVREVDYQ